MNEFLIRRPVLEDLDAIIEHHAQSWRDTYPNDEHGISQEHIEALMREGMLSQAGRDRKAAQLKAYLSSPDAETFYRVALDDNGKVIGHIVGTKSVDTQVLASIYLNTLAQGTGLADDLFGQFEAWCDPSKPTTVDTVEYNHRAIRFYTKHGFVKIPDSEYIHHSGMPSIKMRKEAIV